jgi:hypothetical protein
VINERFKIINMKTKLFGNIKLGLGGGLCLLLAITLWGCRNDEVPTYPEYEIVLASPDDGTTIDMSQNTTIHFGFNEVPDINMYVLMLSRQEDMTAPQEWLVTNNPQLLTTAELDAKRPELGIATGQTTILYWSVRPNSGAYNIKMQVRSLQVVVQPIAVTGVTVSPTTKALNVGGTFTATATITPSDATDKTVSWSSNSATVATVNATTGLVTAAGEGAATITATTNDGSYTATVAVTVAAPAEEKAEELAVALGHASVSGTTVTLTGDVSIADVTVPTGVTLVIPGGMTLTVTGTLTLTGTLTIAGAADVSGYQLSGGILNLSDGSKTKGIVPKPTDAYSGWVWKFYGRTWSDRINVPDCDKSDFAISLTQASCRSAMADAGTLRYYYNWKYVDDNKTAMCPSGWRVPAEADIKTFPEYDSEVSSLLFSEWGYGGWFEEWSNHSNASAAMGLWSLTSSMDNGDNAFIFFVPSWGVDFNVSFSKQRGYQVRCVQD